ncbi:hypothetical protein Bca4012_061960 [Brassica carinata]|uniref:Uncharacterized protein n=1 Tax=Brassica carinata TaxID=52824 RepID=A0A8X7V831_BRACI|nr:hypothetical protein Bca52824_031822 [Brassica carinata]
MDGNRCEPTGMNEEEERELQLHGELRSQTQSSSFQPRDETQPLREPTETNEEEELHNVSLPLSVSYHTTVITPETPFFAVVKNLCFADLRTLPDLASLYHAS